MPEPAEPRTRAEMPSATGLHVFAQREGLWAAAAEAIRVGGQTAEEAVRTLLQAYHQKQLGQPLATAVELVNQIPGVGLHYYVKSLIKLAETPMPQQPAAPVTAAMAPAILSIWEALMRKQPARSGTLKTDGQQVMLGGRPIFKVQDGLVSASWAGRVTLSTASALNALASLAGIPRPFKVGLGDGEALYHDQPVDPMAWLDLGPGPSHSTAMATASADHAQDLGLAPVKTAKTASMGDITPAEWAGMTDEGTTVDSTERGGEGGDAVRQRHGLPLKSAAAKTAVSYPQAVQDKGGDSGKVRTALEKVVHALNEASTAALKFDDRLIKLERDAYGLFREYLAYDQQAQALEAREKAEQGAGQRTGALQPDLPQQQERLGGRWNFKEHQAPVVANTASLSTPPTDERAGEFDHGDVADQGDSVTASAAPTGFRATARLLGKKA